MVYLRILYSHWTPRGCRDRDFMVFGYTISYATKPHRWRNSYRARLEWCKSWVRAPVVSNQRLWNWCL